MMGKIVFTKMTGAGNDFVVFEKKNLKQEISSEFIKSVCNRNFGIGADGVLIIYESDKNDFEVEYYNSDGSIGTLCGNGARCAIQYGYQKKFFQGKTTKFGFYETVYQGEVIEDEFIKFILPVNPEIKEKLTLEVDNKKIICGFVQIGSRHIVIDFDDFLRDYFSSEEDKKTFDEFDIIEIGRKIRYHKEFEPAGVNVNFIQADGKGNLKVRTYERGVENETLACGTGSISSAIIYSLKNNITPPVNIITRSGERMIIDFRKENNTYSEISLSGSARIVFDGNFYLKN